MKSVIEGDILDILPLPNGLIAAYCVDRDGDRMTVAFKRVSLDTGKVTVVSKTIYQLEKFGANYKAFEMRTDSYITCNVILLQNGKEFIIERSGKAKLLDTDAAPVWEGEITCSGEVPSDAVIYKKGLWATFPKANMLIRYNTSTMKEDLKIRGKAGLIEKPMGISVSGGVATLCCAENKTLVKMNLETFEAEKYLEFDEPVYRYVNVKGYELVVFKSGLYLLD